MIIGFDASRAFEKTRTGTEEYSYQLLKNLAKIDTANIYKVFLRPGVKIDESWPKNFQFIRINFSKLWTQVGLGAKTFLQNLDVLFVPAHTLPLIRKPGLKTVITVHDLGSEYLPSMHQLKQRLYLSFMQRFQLKSASKIIAVSKATKIDLVNRIGVDSQKVEVIYEGYDTEKFKVDVVVSSLRPYYQEKVHYFFFVGTVQPRKNLDRIIRAFAKTEGKNLVIAGGSGWMSEKIYKLPKKLGIENRVKFLGYVPDEQLPALYFGAKALVFPSLFEGFGLPILEAQACGCPVLTSNVSSMPEIAGKAALLVDPYSIKAIAHGMMKLEDKAVRDNLIKKGFENIKRFSWENCAKETLEVLQQV